MTTSSPLPRFRSPPVDEVVIGLQFNAQDFLPTHYGAFYDRVKSQYPRVQTLPPVVAVDPMTGNFSGVLSAPLWPRALFVSEDDCSLIQLQNDRLYFNWRRRPHNPDYPHYEMVKKKFAEAYMSFDAFAKAELGAFAPTVSDIIYVNQFTTENTGLDKTSTLSNVFSVWNHDVGAEWKEPAQDLSFNARYPLLGENNVPCGVLSTSMSTGRDNTGSPVARLELAASGMVAGSSLEAILAFHDIGHAAIVRCFAAVTTKSMHNKWDRYQ